MQHFKCWGFVQQVMLPHKTLTSFFLWINPRISKADNWEKKNPCLYCLLTYYFKHSLIQCVSSLSWWKETLSHTENGTEEENTGKHFCWESEAAKEWVSWPTWAQATSSLSPLHATYFYLAFDIMHTCRESPNTTVLPPSVEMEHFSDEQRSFILVIKKISIASL